MALVLDLHLLHCWVVEHDGLGVQGRGRAMTGDGKVVGVCHRHHRVAVVVGAGGTPTHLVVQQALVVTGHRLVLEGVIVHFHAVHPCLMLLLQRCLGLGHLLAGEQVLKELAGHGQHHAVGFHTHILSHKRHITCTLLTQYRGQAREVAGRAGADEGQGRGWDDHRGLDERALDLA